MPTDDEIRLALDRAERLIERDGEHNVLPNHAHLKIDISWDHQDTHECKDGECKGHPIIVGLGLHPDSHSPDKSVEVPAIVMRTVVINLMLFFANSHPRPFDDVMDELVEEAARMRASGRMVTEPRGRPN